MLVTNNGGIEVDITEAVAMCGALAWCMGAEERSEEGLSDISLGATVTFMTSAIEAIKATPDFPMREETTASMRESVSIVMAIVRKRNHPGLRTVD